MQFRLINNQEGLDLYFASGTKNFIRPLGDDPKKIFRFVELYKIILDERSRRLLQVKLRLLDRKEWQDKTEVLI